MKPRRKPGKGTPRTPDGSQVCMQKVLEACAQLPNMGADAGKVRDYIADVAHRALQAPVSGILRREGEIFLLDNISAETARGAGKPALISQARIFAAQALEKKKLVNFRFTFKAEREPLGRGRAQPLPTSQSAFALLALRRTPFTPVEISA